MQDISDPISERVEREVDVSNAINGVYLTLKGLEAKLAHSEDLSGECKRARMEMERLNLVDQRIGEIFETGVKTS